MFRKQLGWVSVGHITLGYVGCSFIRLIRVNLSYCHYIMHILLIRFDSLGVSIDLWFSIVSCYSFHFEAYFMYNPFT
jgi:hypothetical protein